MSIIKLGVEIDKQHSTLHTVLSTQTKGTVCAKAKQSQIQNYQAETTAYSSTILASNLKNAIHKKKFFRKVLG